MTMIRDNLEATYLDPLSQCGSSEPSDNDAWAFEAVAIAMRQMGDIRIWLKQ